MTDPTPALRQAAYWQDVAHRRLRFSALTALLGAAAGFVLHMIVAMPPVWIDDVTAAAAQCGAL